LNKKISHTVKQFLNSYGCKFAPTKNCLLPLLVSLIILGKWILPSYLIIYKYWYFPCIFRRLFRRFSVYFPYIFCLLIFPCIFRVFSVHFPCIFRVFSVHFWPRTNSWPIRDQLVTNSMLMCSSGLLMSTTSQKVLSVKENHFPWWF